MEKTVVQDWDRFTAYLAAQPLCQWAAQKEIEILSMGIPLDSKILKPNAPKKNDNADLAAALASMA